MRRTLASAGLALSVATSSFSSDQYYSVTCDSSTRSCELKEGIIKDESHAYGIFKDEVDVDGWGKLWVHGDESDDGWYEGGFLEGALTAKRIYQHYRSWYNYQFGTGTPTNSTIEFLLDQFKYSEELVRQNSGDEYYSRLGNVLAQFQGVLDGVNYAADVGESLTFTDLLLLEAAGDLYDIIPATNPSNFKLSVGSMSAAEFYDEWHRAVSCSALVKMTDDLSEVFAGHTTWTNYQNMLRIYKNYDLGGGNYQSSHSSKPGVVYSKDDFYVLPRADQRLVVMETTNGVINKDLYELVTPESLLTWQRVPMANSLANNGKDWTTVMSRHNSGTYANQWIVVDMKKFSPGKGVTDTDFLWIVEQAPGISAAADVTETFKKGNFWPSFNIPFQKSVYVITGFQSAYETYGDQYSYEKCPRSQIFSRDHASIQSIDAMKRELRLNQFQTDPISKGDPTYAISSRKDLKPTASSSMYEATGGVDSKVISYSGMIAGITYAQSGPTHDDQTPFQWSGSLWENSTVHWGQPDKFNFDFVDIKFFQQF